MTYEEFIKNVKRLLDGTEWKFKKSILKERGEGSNIRFQSGGGKFDISLKFVSNEKNAELTYDIDGNQRHEVFDEAIERVKLLVAF